MLLLDKKMSQKLVYEGIVGLYVTRKIVLKDVANIDFNHFLWILSDQTAIVIF